METQVKLTKLAKCAGCGAKVGAGTLARMLDGFKSNYDPNLIVGYDKSDDAGVYVINDDTALVFTTDFFPPIVDDPYMFGQIAAANALSDIYAMGGTPKLALNVFCVSKNMEKDTIHEILRGGYDKVYEAGAVIAGGHTIEGEEPVYGLAVNGFVNPKKVLTNSGAKPGDVLILTKPLGVGILTTAIGAEFIGGETAEKVYRQLKYLNKYACEVMLKYNVHSCTDVTGFGLIGHSYEMAQGSGVSVYITTDSLVYYPEAVEMARMGMIPAGAYRNREYASADVVKTKDIELALEDILYDPQTSGGLLMAVPAEEAEELLKELKEKVLTECFVVGYAAEKSDGAVYIV